jgi:hypothetical protein
MSMTTGRVLALQARLDAARNKLDAELDKEAPRDNIVAAFQERVKELHEELKMHIVPAGTCSGIKHVNL